MTRSNTPSHISLALDLQAVKNDLQALYDNGLRSIAVCLMHSYTFPGTIPYKAHSSHTTYEN